MEKSSFFNSVNGDRKYKAQDFADFFNSLLTNGVLPNPSTNLQLISNNNMTVTVKAGKAWINGYVYINDSDLILPIAVADGVLKRIDRIAIRFDTLGRAINAVVKKGTFASTPIANTLQRDADGYELGIADILVSNGVTSIVQANITDLRMNTTYCGWVNSLIQVDTTAIFNQYLSWYTAKQSLYDNDFTNWTNVKKAAYDTWTTAKQSDYDDWYNNTTSTAEVDITNIEVQFQVDFNTWFDTIKNQLGSDVAGSLQTQINNHVNNKTNPHNVTASQVGAEPTITATTTADYFSGAKTFRNLATDVRAVVLTGLSTVTNAVISATDSVLSALGKLQAQITSHLTDNLYQTAGGTATAITLTISETLVTGFPITFIASANNAGAATTINGKKLFKPVTTTSPTLITGKAYSVWYNSSGDSGNGCFFIKASAEGTAQPGDVLAPKTFTNDTDTGLVGTLDLSQLVTGNIKKGITINGVTGKSTVVDVSDTTMDNVAGQLLSGYTAYNSLGNKVTGIAPIYNSFNNTATGFYTSGTSIVFTGFPTGYYVSGLVGIVYSDPTFLASNILSGKSVLGLPGTGIDGTKMQAGDNIICSINNLAHQNGATMIKKREIAINYTGTIRVKFDFQNDYNDGYNANAQIYVNGIPRGTLRTTKLVGYVTYSEDITVNAGDLVQIYMNSLSPSYFGDVMNFKLCIASVYPIGTINQSYVGV